MKLINSNKNKLKCKIIFIFYWNSNAYRLPYISTGILAATGPIFQSYLLNLIRMLLLPHFSTGILAATGPIFQSYLLNLIRMLLLPHFSTGILAATGPIFQSYLLKNKYLSQKSESLNAENVVFAYRKPHTHANSKPKTQHLHGGRQCHNSSSNNRSGYIKHWDSKWCPIEKI